MTENTSLINFFLAILPDSIQTWILLELLRKNLPRSIFRTIGFLPLSQIQMPICIYEPHRSFVARSGLTGMLVKRLLCMPGHNNINYLQLAIRIVSQKHKLRNLSLTCDTSLTEQGCVLIL